MQYKRASSNFLAIFTNIRDVFQPFQVYTARVAEVFNRKSSLWVGKRTVLLSWHKQVHNYIIILIYYILQLDRKKICAQKTRVDLIFNERAT